jgi:predicted RNA-binding Zn ribbon-like protein
LGDTIWLEFVNTARGRTLSPPDLLSDAAAVVRWARAQDLHVDPEPPSLADTLHLRDRLTLLAEALDSGLQPPSASITAINQLLARESGCHQLVRTSGEWQLRFAPLRRPPLLQAIAQSAAATLASSAFLVRRCAGETCSLFFTDLSPNQSRRWCSLSECGREIRIERRRGLLR